MHNKRIGRDDLLKIEVSEARFLPLLIKLTSSISGHELLHPQLGDTKQVVVVTVVMVAVIAVTAEIVETEALLAAVHALLLHAAVMRLLEKMIAAIVAATETASETAIGTTMTADAHELLILEIVIEIETGKKIGTDAMTIVMWRPMVTTEKV